MRFIICGVVGLLLASGTAIGQKSATRFQCSFTTAVRSDGVHRERLDLEFILDATTGKAVVVANNGMSDVLFHSGAIGMTFMELVKSGAVQTTTMSPTGRAVHSRHTMLPTGELIPAQHYGTCK